MWISLPICSVMCLSVHLGVSFIALYSTIASFSVQSLLSVSFLSSRSRVGPRPCHWQIHVFTHGSLSINHVQHFLTLDSGRAARPSIQFISSAQLLKVPGVLYQPSALPTGHYVAARSPNLYPEASADSCHQATGVCSTLTPVIESGPRFFGFST